MSLVVINGQALIACSPKCTFVFALHSALGSGNRFIRANRAGLADKLRRASRWMASGVLQPSPMGKKKSPDIAFVERNGKSELDMCKKGH